LPQSIRGVKFVGTEYQTRYPNLQPGADIQEDADEFIVAEPASSRQFLPKHYPDPIPLQQIQLSKEHLHKTRDGKKFEVVVTIKQKQKGQGS
jgi:hypothetical protein